MAGDGEAREAVRAAYVIACAGAARPMRAPDDELLFLDADSSQQQMPRLPCTRHHARRPGTAGGPGRQTIANVIAAPRRPGGACCSWAEKRAAPRSSSSVCERRARHLVLDVHGAKVPSRGQVQQLDLRLHVQFVTPCRPTLRTHRRFVDRRLSQRARRP